MLELIVDIVAQIFSESRPNTEAFRLVTDIMVENV